jgi:hypothetical protein
MYSRCKLVEGTIARSFCSRRENYVRVYAIQITVDRDSGLATPEYVRRYY